MDVRTLFDLKGNVAVVTGGASGLGFQMATALAEAGADLVIGSRRGDLCRSVCERMEATHKVKALAIQTDVTKEGDVVRLVGGAIERFGKIDILVNNVGGSIIRDTMSTSLAEWQSIVDLNLTSAFLCCREAGQHMRERKYGKIINIASVYGIMAADWRNYVKPENTGYELLSYCSTKGALVNFTRDMAANWAKYNINVNAISPGGFLTEQSGRSGNADQIDAEYSRKKFFNAVPMGRFGDEDDLKGAVVYLASRASKYVTGHNLVVDGGWSIW
jgi:NAD(P)-dependent dehydrogenase (short-subunit alcohol dehydrogenase family)